MGQKGLTKTSILCALNGCPFELVYLELPQKSRIKRRIILNELAVI